MSKNLVTVEISLYPLSADFKPPVRDFIARLRSNPLLTVVCNTMSTQIQGTYDEVFDTLKREMRQNLEGSYRVVFAARFMGPVEGGL